jgi:hypothetical protein
MINLKNERDCRFSAQTVYDIIAGATEFADEDGFVNPFVFERALYLLAYASSKEEVRESIATQLTEGTTILEVWDKIITEQEDEFGAFVSGYSLDMKHIADEASLWQEDYLKYATSPRGLIEGLSPILEGLAEKLSGQMSSLQNDERLKEALNIANKWGMDMENVSAPEVALF